MALLRRGFLPHHMSSRAFCQSRTKNPRLSKTGSTSGGQQPLHASASGMRRVLAGGQPSCETVREHRGRCCPLAGALRSPLWTRFATGVLVRCRPLGREGDGGRWLDVQAHSWPRYIQRADYRNFASLAGRVRMIPSLRLAKPRGAARPPASILAFARCRSCNPRRALAQRLLSPSRMSESELADAVEPARRRGAGWHSQGAPR